MSARDDGWYWGDVDGDYERPSPDESNLDRNGDDLGPTQPDPRKDS